MNKQERARERARRWYAQNKQRRAEYERRNRLAYQLRDGYRRAVQAGGEAVKITPSELLSYWENTGVDPLVCYLTGEPLTEATRSLDHVVPVSRGGGHTLDNLLPCTFAANNRKQDKLVLV